MKIFKFGGASVKNAVAVKNVKSILDCYQNEHLIVVVSAMGKTTNLLEKAVESLHQNNKNQFLTSINECQSFHINIINELLNQNSSHPIYTEIEAIFSELKDKINTPISENFDFEYDQIVSFGEIISTKIIAAYLSGSSQKTIWKDARTMIRTNNNYRSGTIDWDKTKALITAQLKSANKNIIITQGFIGHTTEGFTTTLGREGSDFTAAIFAYCTDATSVTIWKDVPGMLNADPKYFSNTIKLGKISYKETIELAYYGASVIHPKTIKPLQNKNIPLYIKSFIHPKEAGTEVQHSTEEDGCVPSFIFKKNQVLLSITPKDFSFIVEENLSTIFKHLAEAKGHINIMQTSAVSFTVCLDIDRKRLAHLVQLLKQEYSIKYNDDLSLATIRYYDQTTIDRVTKNHEVLMEQKTRNTVRIVMRKQ